MISGQERPLRPLYEILGSKTGAVVVKLDCMERVYWSYRRVSKGHSVDEEEEALAGN